jgi:hypothetical protein
MPVEWQGDHKLVRDAKEDFERELRRLGFEPGDFLVQVRRGPSAAGAEGSRAINYDVYINDLKHPDWDTWKLEGGPGKNWIAEFAKAAKHQR